MGQRLIDHNTIVTDGYGFGEFTPLPDRPEKTQEQRERERQADRIKYRALLREMKLSDSDFEQLQRLGFPKPTSRAFDQHGGNETIFSRRQIAAWVAEVKACAARLP